MAANESTTAPGRLRPQEGDVVVTRESRSVVRYTVRQLPGVEQFSGAVKDESIRLARSFAQRHGVDLWYGENGIYVLLEAYRSSVPAEVRNQSVDVVRKPYWFGQSRRSTKATTRLGSGEGAIMSAHLPNALSEQMLHRICCEFAEMPGLQLTSKQAQRLWALEERICAEVLSLLVDANFLRRIGPDRYARAADGPVAFPRVRMVTAQLDPGASVGLKEGA
jgi:hypothetical protein